jgi:hypothetical protein
MVKREVALHPFETRAVDVDGSRLRRGQDPDDPFDGRLVDPDPGHLADDPRLIDARGVARLRTPLGALIVPGMQLPLPGWSPHRPVGADPLTTHAVEESAQQVDPGRARTAAVTGPACSQRRDPLPQLVRHRWDGAPGRGRPLALSPDPAVVDRVLQHLRDAPIVQAKFAGNLVDRQGADGIPLEDPHGNIDGVRVDGQHECRGVPHESEWGAAARVGETPELRGVSVRDPLTEAPAVPLGFMRLGHHLVPVSWIRTHQPPIAHDPGDPGRMEAVLDQLQGASQVALPPIEVAGQQDVKRPGRGGGEHVRPGAGTPDGATALRNLVHDLRVHEAVALDEPIHLLVLRLRPVSVVLTLCRLAHPTGGPKTAEVIKRGREPTRPCQSHRRASARPGDRGPDP